MSDHVDGDAAPEVGEVLTTEQAVALARWWLAADGTPAPGWPEDSLGLVDATPPLDAIARTILAWAPVVAAAEAQTDAWAAANGKPNAEPLEDDDWVDATGDTEAAVRAMRAAGGGA